MKKNYKALILSMAAVIALTTTSSAMAMHVPGLSQMHSLNAKLAKKKRKLTKTTNQADNGVVNYKSQAYLDRKGNKEDKTEVQIAVLEQEKAALIRQYPHLKAYSNGSAETTEVIQHKSESTGSEKHGHGHGHDHGASDEAYVILDDGTEVRLRDLQAYSLGGDENVAGNGQGKDPVGNGQGKDPVGNGQGTDPNNGGTDPNNGGTDPNNGGTDPNNGGTDPNNGGTDPNNGGTDPNNGGTDPNNGGTDPNNGGTDPGTVPPKNEKKKTEGGDRQDQKDPKKGKEKSAPAKTTPAKTTPAKTTPAKTTPAKTTPAKTTPAKTSTPPKNEKKKTVGGDRQDQPDDKKAKQKAEQVRLDREAKAAADEIARLKREAARKKAEDDAAKQRQAQIDKKNEEKKEEEKKSECELPVVGEKECLPVEEEKVEQAEVSGDTYDVKYRGGLKKIVRTTSKTTYGQSGIQKGKTEVSREKVKAELSGENLNEREKKKLSNTFNKIMNSASDDMFKVDNRSGLKKIDETAPAGTTTERVANTSNSNRAQ